MRRAQKRDAVNTEMFFFRKNLAVVDGEEVKGQGSSSSFSAVTSNGSYDESHVESHDHDESHVESHDHEYTLMTIDTIMNGKVRCVLFSNPACNS